MWIKDIYNTDNMLVKDISLDRMRFKKFFINKISEGLYKNIQLFWNLITNSNTHIKEFNSLSKDEKSLWYDYAAAIPDKFKILNLFIRPCEDFCRTCIITDNEIATLVQMDYDQYKGDLILNDLMNNKTKTIISKNNPFQKSFKNSIKDWNRFYQELNYLIPVQLKKIGYEIIRYEEAVEINMVMIKKLARAIHARYLHEIRNQGARIENDTDNYIFNNQGDFTIQHISDFDNLPEEIKYSNIDNAAHIPTKLLSIGYKVRQVKKGFKPVALHLKEEEIETMARVEHLRWSWEKRLNGWILGSIKDDIKKTHPSLIPFEELNESEKEKDRELVKLIPALLQDINYEVIPVSPNRIKKLSYAIKPQSSIHKILNETRELNDQIRKLATLTPEIEEMIRIRNKKIEEAISEVEGSYNYAQHIQETFLPDDLYVRECFPDSFVLFKPKDIVSGDFYFFSKRDDLIIFALVDCTGHGIPGALISTIGYGNLDQVINVEKITDPVDILRHLYSDIHRFLRRNIDGYGLSDDMDIALCVLDTRTNLLTFSGVGASIYYIREGKITEIKSESLEDDSDRNEEYIFSSEKVQMKIGDTLYLCSDGYVDQFGGKNHKKYSRKRLMNFLVNLQVCSMPEQSDRLYEEIEQWREENNEDQTDDILVIGIRI
jgi:serine phosphatase RsbU (regulator of sigma subunit)